MGIRELGILQSHLELLGRSSELPSQKDWIASAPKCLSLLYLRRIADPLSNVTVGCGELGPLGMLPAPAPAPLGSSGCFVALSHPHSLRNALLGSVPTLRFLPTLLVISSGIMVGILLVCLLPQSL